MVILPFTEIIKNINGMICHSYTEYPLVNDMWDSVDYSPSDTDEALFYIAGKKGTQIY